MALTADDIKDKQFNSKMRGYDRSEVDEFLKEVSETINSLTEQNHQLAEENQTAKEQLRYFTEMKDSLNKSILVAQEAADKVKTNAKREAEIMVREAQKQATDIVAEANSKANQVIETSADDTRKLTTETNDLKKQTRIFRQRLQVMLESQLEVVKSKDWDTLLANDDLSKYDEIQKILGSRLDKDSDDSVKSSPSSQPTASSQPAVEKTPSSEQQQATEQATPAEDNSQPAQPNQENGAGETVVIFPDDDQAK
ncbi:MAG TPA: DivIVA domain-containing protein [Candidatus Limosilactobacillus merdipullorum]|uniref:DivIVA domain-containing protein n=1 Tax=Candidatus Limosilactobacillus merdipullorum TaxID=2838653 RepID=A0A9D1U3D4_9LACO|nr:DivIVA domain-containing protein [Candidatus Limosilactobacillus merdipullorum]